MVLSGNGAAGRRVSRGPVGLEQRARHFVVIGEAPTYHPLNRTVGIAEAEPACRIHVLGCSQTLVEETQGSVVFRAQQSVEDATWLIGADYDRQPREFEDGLGR